MTNQKDHGNSATVSGFARWLREYLTRPRVEPRRGHVSQARSPEGEVRRARGGAERRLPGARRPQNASGGDFRGRTAPEGTLEAPFVDAERTLRDTLVDNREGTRGQGQGDTSPLMRPAPHNRDQGEVGSDSLLEADLEVVASMEGAQPCEETCPKRRVLDSLVLGADTWAAVNAFLGQGLEAEYGLPQGAFAQLLVHSVLSGDVYVPTDGAGEKPPQVKIGRHVLSEMMGSSSAKKARTKTFLEAYQDRVPAFSYVNYSKGNHSRLVENHGLPDDLLDTLEGELRKPYVEVERPVLVGDAGRAPTPARRDQAALRRVENEMHRVGRYAVQRRLIPHLNSLPTNSLSRKVRENAAEGIQATVDAYEDRSQRLIALADLQRVQVVPHAVYGPSLVGRSPRVFPLSLGVVTLKREVRRALLQGCHSFDLTNSQLAIVGRLLEVGPVLDLLEREGSAWRHLVQATLGRELESETELNRVKHPVKRAVYATVYGMSMEGVRERLTQALSGDAATRFLSDHVVQALFEARDKELARICQAGGVDDIYGCWHSIHSPGFKYAAAGARSAFACQMQAAEMWLLEPVIDDAIAEAAKRRPDYRFVVWQHDGFTISVSRREATIIERLKGLVAGRADEMGVPTHLEFQKL